MNSHYQNLRDCAYQCKSRGEMAKRFPAAYREIRRRGLTHLFAHMPRLRRPKYTPEELRQIAAQYESRTEFQHADNAAYMAAWRRGIIDDICPPSQIGAHLRGAKQ